MRGGQGENGTAGFNGSVGPMGMNGTDAMLILSGVDLFSSCQTFTDNCTILNRMTGCNVRKPFPVVPEVRVSKCQILLIFQTA